MLIRKDLQTQKSKVAELLEANNIKGRFFKRNGLNV